MNKCDKVTECDHTILISSKFPLQCGYSEKILLYAFKLIKKHIIIRVPVTYTVISTITKLMLNIKIQKIFRTISLNENYDFQKFV